MEFSTIPSAVVHRVYDPLARAYRRTTVPMIWIIQILTVLRCAMAFTAFGFSLPFLTQLQSGHAQKWLLAVCMGTYLSLVMLALVWKFGDSDSAVPRRTIVYASATTASTVFATAAWWYIAAGYPATDHKSERTALAFLFLSLLCSGTQLPFLIALTVQGSRHLDRVEANGVDTRKGRGR
ncbi:uncharacterized protein F5Z01DRAFT_380850 [Emericellopsis atlantica]|uniref:Uncharacterized protein n=1 Tax=Emericellopsis atlantica TaxID=2614577 RepID=A0A9P7ZDW3_9HYPO|nr:uncharacterized protein F5Z01DRAFT_380850 [Emericellopsis atlantica]KAG9250284.1 hypothetical protein F5Z01DRAFT_380850 [Emericellopsis atlantica]